MMNQLYYPLIKGILWVLFLLSLPFLFGSCVKEKNEIWINTHSLIFEPGNEETYSFADLQPDSLSTGDRTIPNGYKFKDGSSYHFRFIDGKIIVMTGRKPTLVKYYSSGLDRKPEILPVVNKTFSKELEQYSHFIVEYNWMH